MSHPIKNYWQDFEKLIVLFLHDVYKSNPDIIIKRTQSTNDGGYDVLLIFEGNEDKNIAIAEAKLRKFTTKDLPLSDFSKTLVVAINLLADEMTIATNLHFSKGTSHKMKLFEQRTGLQIHKINGYDIFRWMKQRTLFPGIDKQLIQLFYDHQDSIEKYPTEDPIYSTPNDNVLEPIFGNKRNDLLQACFEAIINFPSTYIIEGAYGIGKSCFIQNLIYKLNQNKIITYKIDAYQIDSAKLLFIELLAFAWGIDKNEILRYGLKDIKEIFEM